jgi:hypothetical protein
MQVIRAMMSVKMSSRIESGRHSSVRKRPSEEVRDRAHVALGEVGVPGGAGAGVKQGDADEPPAAAAALAGWCLELACIMSLSSVDANMRSKALKFTDGRLTTLSLQSPYYLYSWPAGLLNAG